MDHDMLALCDLAPYFEEDFEGNLLMGRMFGPNNTLGVQLARRGGLPEKLKHAENYPYFYMGPMMNLKAMREEGTWQKLLTAHKTLGQDEQMALTIATEGRVKGVGRKWNLVPHWDNLVEGPEGPEKSLYGTVGEAAEWKNGLPEGIIHWTGWAKPWHQGSGVWRPDLWAAEETTWEELRNGWWEKPRAAVVESRRGRKSVRLAKRGWKVDFFPVAGAAEEETFAPPKKVGETKTGPRAVHWEGFPIPQSAKDSAEPPKEEMEGAEPLPFPDLRVHPVLHGADGGPAVVSPVVAHSQIQFPESAEFVRFGPGIHAADFLENRNPVPSTIIVQGPVALPEMLRLRKLGYAWEVRIKRTDWSEGGPAPSVLDFVKSGRAAKAVAEEDVYLRTAAHP